jgi:predicted nucleic acid-binding protein
LAYQYQLTPAIVEKTIELRKAYKIKLPDAIIAATALVNKLTLISRDTNDFRKVKGLKVIAPYK